MRIRLGVSPDIDTDTMGEAIDAALEASTVSQVPLIENGKVPDIRTSIKAGRVKWQPEPPGDEHFDDAKTVLSRGWGDCDDLAPWLAASLRASGEDPDARAFVYQSGPKRWHAVVEQGDGKVLDPSKWAGMGGKRKRVQGIGAPAWEPMWPERLGIATHPFAGGYAGRVDLPDEDMPLSWSAITHAPSRAMAVRVAARGVHGIADACGTPYEEDIARLVGLDALLSDLSGEADMHVVGDIMGELADYLGEEGVAALVPAARAFGDPSCVGFGLFKKAFKAIKSVAKPLASVATPLAKAGLSFVPGGGAATAAFDVATKLAAGQKRSPTPPPAYVTAPTAQELKQGQSRPGTTLSMPGGVVIVRF